MLAEGLLQILDKVYEHEDFDFRQYKESSLKRRVERRLRATKVDSYNQYINVLSNDPSEYTKLVENLTIQVSDFFRDPEAWQILRERIIPKIIAEKNKKTGQSSKPKLRVWCAGCATGEEVYSITMLIDQILGENRTNFEVNICGTDIDKRSLIAAQKGEYNLDMRKTVPLDYMNTYFDDQGKFRTNASIEDGPHFRSHDLVLDEPLKQMDLIICRNVAIYFTRPLQEKVFQDFHSGLNENGYLFLGKAETMVGHVSQRFNVIDRRWKFYQKSK